MRAKKRCSKCKQTLLATLEYFYHCSRNIGGLSGWCKKCHNKDGKQRRGTKHGKASIKKGIKKYRASTKGKAAQQEYQHSVNGLLRQLFNSLKSRCTNPNDKDYANYGGRGIGFKFKDYADYRDHVVNNLGYTHAKLHEGLQIGRIDINGDYEKGNLQMATQFQLQQNSRKVALMNGAKTSSRFKGVCWHKGKERWYASITANGERYHLGSFDGEIDAARAYDKASCKHHGEYGLNNEDLGLYGA